MSSQQKDLTDACESGNTSVLESILATKSGYDINLQNTKGETPLIRASIKNKVAIVKLLLDSKDIDVNLSDKNGWQAIHWSAKRGFQDITALLIAHGCEINTQDRNGATPIYLCINNLVASSEGSETFPVKFLTCLKYLLNSDPLVDLANDEKETPLMLASKGGATQVVELLLEKKASVNLKRGDRATALYLACTGDYSQIAEILLASEADHGLKGSGGKTPVCVTCEKGHSASLEILLRHGADPALPDNTGRPPILHAARKGHAKCVELLLQYKVPIDFSDVHSPTRVAKEYDHTAVVNLLEDYVKYPGKYHALASPLTNTLSIVEPECSYFRSCKRFVSSVISISEEFLDASFNVCFCVNCHSGRQDASYFKRGDPPKSYGLPIGWCKFGLKLPPRASALKALEDWHVAFHGTKIDCVKKVLEAGDLFQPGDVLPHGEIRPPSNHFDDKASNPIMRPPQGHDIYKVYLSPSIKYAGHNAYAPPIGFTDERTKTTFRARVAFQVRIQPDQYDIGAKTVYDSGIDPKFSDGELEWSTKKRGVIILVGLMVNLSDQPASGQPTVVTQNKPRPPTARQICANRPGATATKPARKKTATQK